jgi:tight adherence protein C
MSLAFVVISVFAVVAAAVIYVGNGVIGSGSGSTQRLASLRSRRDMLDSRFSERAFAPIIRRFGRFITRYTPAGWAERTTKRLTYAGWTGRLDSTSWAAIRVIAVVAGVIAALILQSFFTGMERLVIAGLSLAVGYLGPDAVLNRTIDERREQMRKDLPDLIDLLVISVEAGLGFESALGRVVQTVPGELSDEFARMLQETRVGVSRREAMRNLGNRTDIEELNSFVMAIIQAEAFGVSISRVLRVQAAELRTKRRQLAQERAFKAPVKMVFPLVLCIFPALFVVLLGPAVMEIYRNFVN